MRGKAPASVAGPGDRVAPTSAEATARLLWEACRRDPDPAAVWRALAGGADAATVVAAAADHRIGPLLWRALGVAEARNGSAPGQPTSGA